MSQTKNSTEASFYKVGEVARILKFSVRSIYRRLESGELNGYKIGGQWRITKKHILDFIAKQKINN